MRRTTDVPRVRLRSALCLLAILTTLLMACTPPPAPSSPTAAAAAKPTDAPKPAAPAAAAASPATVASPAAAASPAASASPSVAASPAASPAAGTSAAPKPVAAAPSSCKVAQLYTSPTYDKGWSWAHEQSFLRSQEGPAVRRPFGSQGQRARRQQAGREDLLESMVQQGAKVVYTTSFGFMEPTRAVAAKHPDVAFFHASGFPDPNDPPNIGYYFATIEEGRYITGEVAGLAVDPGANIGYVAAFPIPEVFRGENAFALGVAQDQPDCEGKQSLDADLVRPEAGEGRRRGAARHPDQGPADHPAPGLASRAACGPGGRQVRHRLRRRHERRGPEGDPHLADLELDRFTTSRPIEAACTGAWLRTARSRSRTSTRTGWARSRTARSAWRR